MPGTIPPEARLSKLLVLLLAAASGAVVGNLYFNQPLLAAIPPMISNSPNPRLGSLYGRIPHVRVCGLYRWDIEEAGRDL